MKTFLPFLILLFSISSFGQVGTKLNSATNLDVRIAELQQKKKALLTERALLLVKYTPDYIGVKEKEALITDIDNELAVLISRVKIDIAEPLSNAATSLLLQIETLRSRIRMCVYDSALAFCSSDQKRKLADAYQAAALQPDVVKALFGEAIEKFDGSRESTKSAIQVSQIADEQNAELFRLLVVQNQRIIQLLEQILKKR